ncbi:hypothetical protein [Niameybacter massiliensis]|uniref:hypothetical protein n=1 Tax=Niameybacter massiliensis TaxID=1658108 RepID=UPI0006B667E7|nr:hypothetical protein [Niameybacter massiliensis]
MYNANKDFNKIKVWVNFDTRYEHPKETARNLWAIIETIYEHYNEIQYTNLEKIDRNLLKYVMDKLEGYYNDLRDTDSVLEETKEAMSKKWQCDPELIAVGTYAVPLSRVEFTLSELITLYKVLEFAKKHTSILKEYIWIVRDEYSNITFINQIQEQISDRLTYVLCLSDKD